MDRESGWEDLFRAPLRKADREIFALVDSQRVQNEGTVNLVASETYCPRATLEAEASVLINRNASGYPPRRSMGGSQVMDDVELLAAARAARLFGAEHANVQPLSSTIANVAVFRALLRPGDRILFFDRGAGGHESHGGATHISGQDYQAQAFGVVDETGEVDYEAAERLARELQPRMIVAGASSYPKAIDFARLRRIADSAGSLLFADLAHVAGLVVGGLHPNPTPFCDVVTTSTHKTLCGPRTGGLILCKSRYAADIDAAVSPGLQAAPGGHIIAARAVLFDLVSRPPFRALMRAVVDNAARLSDALQSEGMELYAGGTDSHMVVVDLRASEWDAAALNSWLFAHGVVANTVTLPRRPALASRLGLRLGSTAMTIRGASGKTFGEIGRSLGALIDGAQRDGPDPSIAVLFERIARNHPIPYQA